MPRPDGPTRGARDSARAAAAGRFPGGTRPQGPATPATGPVPPAPSVIDRPASTAAIGLYHALLPLRLFLGGMLLYAGLDKLITPGFLAAAGPGSIGDQLHGFVRVSPLAPLVTAFALPMPVIVGLLIALAEIAVGLGALTGLLYRLSATVGALLALMFWLTASWTIRPIYLGPDLPYAAGWITLALAGHGDLYVLGPWLAEVFGGAEGPLGRTVAADGRRVRYGRPVRMPSRWTREVSPERRVVLELGVLGLAALAVGAAGGVFGKLFRGDDSGAQSALGSGDGSSGAGSGSGSAVASPTASDTTSGSTAASGSTGAGSAPAGTQIASLSQLPKRSAIDFSDPNTGDPSVLVRLADGKVVAFDAICTHAGCVVGYDQGSGLLLCPCHGAAFDPAHDAQVVGGPAPVPLTPLPIQVNSSTGQITLTG